MKIYTSYYGNMRNIPKDVVCIAISIYMPEKINIVRYSKLQPPKKVLKQYRITHDISSYIDNYICSVLSNLTIQEVLDDLEKLSEGRDVCLMCYEKPPAFCHRTLVANWLSLHGMPCEELYIPSLGKDYNYHETYKISFLARYRYYFHNHN